MLELTTDTRVNVAESAIVYGGGVFETVRIARYVPLFLETHLERMASGLAALEMDPSPPAETVRSFIRSFLLGNDIREGALRLLAVDDRLMVMQRDTYPRPVSAEIGIAPHYHRTSKSSLQGIKSAAYLENRLLTRRAQQDSLFDRIACNERNQLTDGGRCNLFVVRENELLTPPVTDGALPGVTRTIVLRFPGVREESLTAEDLRTASAGCITSSLAGVLPVSRVRDVVDWDPAHPVLKKAVQQYEAAVREQIEQFAPDDFS